MNISEKIKYLRQEAGLSQSQLAQELYVSRAAVAKWENDNGIPDVENLKALAAYFGCDVDTLLDDTKQVCGFDSPKSYCGKDCVSCEEYSCNRCSGRTSSEYSCPAWLPHRAHATPSSQAPAADTA